MKVLYKGSSLYRREATIALERYPDSQAFWFTKDSVHQGLLLRTVGRSGIVYSCSMDPGITFNMFLSFTFDVYLNQLQKCRVNVNYYDDIL